MDITCKKTTARMMNTTPSVVYNFSPLKLISVIGLVSLTLLITGFSFGVSMMSDVNDLFNQPRKVIKLTLAPLDDLPDHLTRVYTPPQASEEIEYVDWNPKSLDEEIDCMAKNIYFESRNEDIVGQIAVGLATINRVKDPAFPNTVCDVVWEKRRHKTTGKWVAQFSWTWDGKKDEPLEKHHWEESLVLASAMLAERSLDNFVDITNGADHYHATYVNPYWGKKLRVVFVNGLHIFYSRKVKFDL